MSTLSRYQKSGGFLQLLQLIETCGKQKQDNFLLMIENEDQRWSDAIKEKMLTMERILSWNNSVLGEIAGRLQQLTVATLIHSLKPEDATRLVESFSHSQKRAIEDLKNSKTPSAAEVSSAAIKVLQEVRTMITQGYIRLDKVAPSMFIPEDIEDKLGKTGAFEANEPIVEESSKLEVSNVRPIGTAKGGNTDVKDTAEYNTLNNKYQQLQTENNNLKSEVKLLRDKLAQIRKIA
jgi:hypothetical protein